VKERLEASDKERASLRQQLAYYEGNRGEGSEIHTQIDDQSVKVIYICLFFILNLNNYFSNSSAHHLKACYKVNSPYYTSLAAWNIFNWYANCFSFPLANATTATDQTTNSNTWHSTCPITTVFPSPSIAISGISIKRK
jgi:hypothetical protein